MASIPPSWIEQLTADGLLLVNLRGELTTGNGCLLAPEEPHGRAVGQFLPIDGWPLPLA